MISETCGYSAERGTEESSNVQYTPLAVFFVLALPL